MFNNNNYATPDFIALADHLLEGEDLGLLKRNFIAAELERLWPKGFKTASELAEAIIAGDERGRQGEIFWAVSLGIAISQTKGKLDAKVLRMVASVLDKCPEDHEGRLTVFDEAIETLLKGKNAGFSS